MLNYRALITATLLVFAFNWTNANQVLGDSIEQDTVASSNHRNIFKKFLDYMGDNDNKDLETKGLRFSVLGGPYYNTDVKFGVALVGCATYRLKGCDSSVQPSNTSAFGTISTAGFWTLGIDGTTFMPEDKSRLNYTIAVGYSPRNFWGIGYDNAINDSLKTKLRQNNIKIETEYIVRILPNFYVGPSLLWNYNKAKDIDKMFLLDGVDMTVRNYGVGFTLQYDTRDLYTNASRGVYVYLNTMFNPKFLWNKYDFTSIKFNTSYYHTAWKGAVIAGEITTNFNIGNPSWASMALFGNNNTMRGYYKGQFRDKHMTTAQVELRQHVWRRNGLVLWAGFGKVFHDWDSFKAHTLPNYGIGYRWEFRRKMNIRLDLGFGAHGSSGFTFSMNEAF